MVGNYIYVYLSRTCVEHPNHKCQMLWMFMQFVDNNNKNKKFYCCHKYKTLSHTSNVLENILKAINYRKKQQIQILRWNF
jgi:hypothetical protein